MSITTGIIIGIIITFCAMSAIGIYTTRKVKNASDFTVAGNSSSAVMVAGAIVGSCVGAGGTVGTAEAAFKIGLGGWWQTLGLSIGCLVLGLLLSQAVYLTKVQTVPQLLEKNFGANVRPITAIFSSVAIFFSILSQAKGFLPLLTSFIPVPLVVAAAIAVILVLLFVIFGGIFATSLGGILKMVLILVALLLSGIVSVVSLGGFSGIVNSFDAFPYFSMFPDGVGKGLAKGLGLMLGVLVTQVYIQAVLSAKDAKAARNGAVIAAICTCPTGLFGVAVGLYMNKFFPAIEASQAFPLFMKTNFHPILAGIFIGGLMLATLGSNAGLTLGISTMLSRDVYKTKIRKSATDKEMLIVLRILIIIVATLSGIFAITSIGEMIQTFVFLSFGLRTCVFLVPMMFALFYKGRMSRQAGMAAVLIGPLVNIIWNVIPALKASFDPVYVGLIAAFVSFVTVNALTLTKADKDMREETLNE
ncbi:MAG: sodium:solute symporter family protein [Lachnospiraceae bacterium]